jgi:hypothetical protein
MEFNVNDRVYYGDNGTSDAGTVIAVGDPYPEAAMNKTFFTVTDIKRAAKANGSYFFSTGSMNYFQSTVLSQVYPIDGGAFFVTGENDDNGQRRYTVRLALRADVTESGQFSIRTIGDFMGYATAHAAKLAAVEARANHTN